MQNYLLYQATGSPDQVNECRYALIKYLSLYNLKPPHTTSVIIDTDRPAMFEAFAPYFKHFEMKSPAPATKLETINKTLTDYEGNFLFCDTDTYPVMPLEILFDDLEKGKVYVYDESKKNEANQDMIIGSNNSNKKIVRELMEPGTVNTVQSDLGLPQIKNAGLFFRHYKNLPEFKILLQRFFTKNEEENVPNLIKAAHYFDAQQILKQKAEYDNLPFYKKWLKSITGTGWSIKQYEKKF